MIRKEQPNHFGVPKSSTSQATGQATGQANISSPLGGTLYGISVGPGDPDLITVKALRILQQVNVVACPKGMGDRPGVAQTIVAKWLTPDQDILPLSFPYVQENAELESAWIAAAKTVWTYLCQGQDVGFICEGDISFYSTFTYLAQTIQHLYPAAKVEAIPGVCSPMASATALDIPLTVRSQRLTILPALYAVDDLESVLQSADVIVLMKMSSVYEQIWSLLQHNGLLAHSHVVEWATHPQQRVYKDLSDRPHLKLSYFSIMIINCSSQRVSF